MPLVRRIKRRGATIVVEAHAEVLFAATGDVGRWTNRFSQRARAFTAAEAPVNKRPRWAHYGKPLKDTFTASTTYQPNRFRVYSAVGSSADHAAFVDQGTGIYNGGSPYEAKILPPWKRGEGSLYENTWRPGGKRVAPVLIKGQRGQGFFENGLSRAFESMRMRAFQVQGDPRIAKAAAEFPSTLLNFVGSDRGGAAFRAQLEEWRAWRSEAFDRGRLLGKDATGYRPRTRTSRATTGQTRRTTAQSEARRVKAAERARKARQIKAKNKPTKVKTTVAVQRAEKNRFLAAIIKKYGASNVESASLTKRGGYYYVTVKTKDASGRNTFKEVRGKATV